MAERFAKFILRKSKKIRDPIREILTYDKKLESYHISEPLKENPNDLGNIHKPTIREYTLTHFVKGKRKTIYDWWPIIRQYAMTYFVERKRKTIYDWWYSAILKDEKRNLYFFISFFHPSESYYRFTRMGRDKNLKKLGLTLKFPIIGGKFDAIGYSERDEMIDFCVPKTTRPQSLKKPFARCAIKVGESRLILETNELAVNLIFSSLGMPFWINKGREAICTPRGDTMSGFYDISNVEGSILFNARRIKVSGVGINEHLMSFVPPERYWKRIDGIFFCTDQIYCAFIYLEKKIGIRMREYKDGAIVIRATNEYLIPIDFKIEYLKYDHIKNFPSKIRIVANTKKGELNAVAKVIGKIERQLAFKIVDAKFVFNDGRELRLTNGYGQHALH